jgi:hypothetical protein
VIDGGVSISNTTRIIDLLEEFAKSHSQIKLFGYGGGGISAAVGLALLSLNPGAIIVSVTNYSPLGREK